jgi:hypothetical protein
MGPESTLLRFDAAALELAARFRNTPLRYSASNSRIPPFSMAAHWFYRGRTNLWPGAAIACRPIRWH